MDKNDLINRYKCGERNFVGVDLSDANLSGADLRYADLSYANLIGANLGHANLWNANLGYASLIKANLSDADLSYAVIRSANLEGANLRGADLRGVNLSRANLSDANLWYANLWKANLSDASLRFANLRLANLSFANLIGTNLVDANFSKADLSNANFSKANLRRTVLDPANEFKQLSEEEFLSAGFEMDGGRVIGYRTKMSVACGNTQYVNGETYTAPVFSTDADITCHPGIYLAPLSWMKREYPRWSLVKVSAAISDVLHCGTKWRAREIFVIEDYEEKNGQKDTN